MRRSTDRILTTHVGSLIRTREIIEGMKARRLNTPHDEAALEAAIRTGVAQVVKQQIDVGIDIPSDGEYGRFGFWSYIHERLGGLEPRALEAGESVWGDGAERRVFPEFFQQYDSHFRFLWMLPEVSLAELQNLLGSYERFRLVRPIEYTGQQAMQREIDTFKAALEGQHVADAFIPAVTPVSRKGDADVLNFYPSEEAYLYALADALHAEYLAITGAGFILQLDWAALHPTTAIAGVQHADEQKVIEQGIDVVNHALRDIPEERVRYHHCWGSHSHPHTQDVPLSSIVHLMLKIKAQAYSIEAANVRHEHEWMVWQDVKLPPGKILIPGMVSHHTNLVEHPELVAWRIRNYASVVGKENVIAGTDCGFSQYWDQIRVHPSVQWAKLRALVEGAALASKDLWP